MGRGPGSLPGPRHAAFAFLTYLAWSAALYGGAALPRLGRVLIGAGHGDAKLFVWALAWWPHALITGADALHPHAIWAPTGQDLAWVTSVPGPALAMAPITLGLGPLVSSNLLHLLAPALAGWAVYLVCARLTRSVAASWAGGFLFASSSYLAGQLRGHLNLYLVFPVPLAIWIVLAWAEGALPASATAGLLGLVLAAEASISTEVLATLTLFGGIAAVACWILGDDHWRPRIVRLLPVLAGAYLLAGVLASPILIPALSHVPPGPIRRPGKGSVDLLSFLVPRTALLVGGRAFAALSRRFPANTSEDGAYVPLPLLALLCWRGWTRRKDRITRVLLTIGALAGLAALGPRLHVLGRSTIPLPWALVVHVPLIQDAVPARTTLYLWLAASAELSRALAEPPASPTVPALVVAGAVLLLPNVWAPSFDPPARIPPAILDGEVGRIVAPNDTAVVIPARKGDDMLWQAVSDFRFRLAGGRTGSVPPSFRGDPAWHAIRSRDPGALRPWRLRAFLVRHGVDAVLVDPGEARRWAPILDRLPGRWYRLRGLDVFRPHLSARSRAARRATGVPRRRRAHHGERPEPSSGRADSNRRPRAPKARALPACATPRREARYPTGRSVAGGVPWRYGPPPRSRGALGRADLGLADLAARAHGRRPADRPRHPAGALGARDRAACHLHRRPHPPLPRLQPRARPRPPEPGARVHLRVPRLQGPGEAGTHGPRGGRRGPGGDVGPGHRAHAGLPGGVRLPRPPAARVRPLPVVGPAPRRPRPRRRAEGPPPAGLRAARGPAHRPRGPPGAGGRGGAARHLRGGAPPHRVPGEGGGRPGHVPPAAPRPPPALSGPLQPGSRNRPSPTRWTCPATVTRGPSPAAVASTSSNEGRPTSSPCLIT